MLDGHHDGRHVCPIGKELFDRGERRVVDEHAIDEPAPAFGVDIAGLGIGEGDALATQTYARAYSKDPDFYAFYRSMQAYERSLGRDGDLLVVTPDGEFFKYLKDPGSPKAPAPRR